MSPGTGEQNNPSRARPSQTTEYGVQRSAGAIVSDLTGETLARSGPGPPSMARTAARNRQENATQQTLNGHATAFGVRGAQGDVTVIDSVPGAATVTAHAPTPAPAPESLERPDIVPAMGAQPFAPAALVAFAEIAGFARDLSNASAVPLPNKVLNGILMRRRR